MGLRRKPVEEAGPERQYIVEEAISNNHVANLMNEMDAAGYMPVFVTPHHVGGSTVGYQVAFKKREEV